MHAKPTLQQLKIDLAIALRWAARLGLNEGVCNHFSLQVPGSKDQFLLNPQGLHWSEIEASDILVVDSRGHLIEGKHSIEPTAFFIHSKIHIQNPKAQCVLHTHMPYATALCSLKDSRIKWVTQNALRFYNQIAYDDIYNGVALDDAEGNRIASKLEGKKVLFLANHGVIVTGADVASTFDDLYYLERTAMVQVLAQSTGKELRHIPAEICQQAYQQIESERQQAYLHFEAIKRILLRESPTLADG